jgi:hypothetical protein
VLRCAPAGGNCLKPKEKSMPIRVNCECGKVLNVKDHLEGKRIKCPECGDSLLVEESSTAVHAGDPPQRSRHGGSSSGIGKKASKNSGGKKSGGGKKFLFAVLGIGVLLAGSCCLSSVGVAAWWFWPGGASSALEKKIVGKWVSDIEPPKKDAKPADLMKLALAGMIEFKADGTVLDASPMTPILMGKWKTVSTQGDVITVELSDSRNAKKLDIKMVSDNNVKITPDGSKLEFAFKRAP